MTGLPCRERDTSERNPSNLLLLLLLLILKQPKHSGLFPLWALPLLTLSSLRCMLGTKVVLSIPTKEVSLV